MNFIGFASFFSRLLRKIG